MRVVVILNAASKYRLSVDRTKLRINEIGLAEIEKLELPFYYEWTFQKKLRSYPENHNLNLNFFGQPKDKPNTIPRRWVKTSNEESILPSKDDLLSFRRANPETQVVFIDTMPLNVFLRNEKELDSLKELGPWVVVEDQLNLTLKTFREDSDIEQIDIYDFTGFESVYEFLYQTSGKFIEKERYHFNVPHEKIKMNQLTSLPETPYYNLFSMEEYKPGDIFAEKSLYTLTTILVQYLRKGFATGIINPEPELTWEMNLNIPEMDLFLRQFDLYPRTPDLRDIYQHQFFGYAQYRQVVTVQLAKVISRMCIVNGFTVKKRKSSDYLNPEYYIPFLRNFS